MCLGASCIDVCAPDINVCGAYGSQKRMSDLLELGLQTAASHHAGAGNQTQILRERSVSSPTASSPQSPPIHIFKRKVYLSHAADMTHPLGD